MQVFYTPGISGKFATLPSEESRHCINVMRFSFSDTIHLIDGRGGFYKALIIKPDPRACEVEITEYQADFNKRSCRLHLAVAPTKQIDRFEWLLEKAVECGVDEITPVRCQRSERKEIKTERLEKLIIASMKQAIVAEKPRLNEMIPYPQFIRSSSTTNPDKFIAYCTDQRNKLLKDDLVRGRDAILLIGPEGDFAPDEIQLALASGYTPVSLGTSRLRTETAALAGCVVFSMINS
jgi:16S rRNA (uracil1498-N3)-methyltransferase